MRCILTAIHLQFIIFKIPIILFYFDGERAFAGFGDESIMLLSNLLHLNGFING